jgi:hypothetical protein
VDLGFPGFDFTYGFGRVDALAALRSVSPGPRITLGLALDRHAVSPGDAVHVDISVANAGGATVQDLYFAIRVPAALSTPLGCPAGDAVVFLTGGFSGVAVVCAATAPPNSYAPLYSNVALPAALPPITVPDFFSLVWSEGIPGGTYTFFIFTTPPAAFADGTVVPGDISALASDSFQASL